jgi:hypothetical protein
MRFNPSPQILEQFKRQLTLHHTIRYSQSGGQTDVLWLKPLWAYDNYDFQVIFRFTDLYDHESGHYRCIARLSLIQNMSSYEWNEINVPYLKDGSPKSNYWPHMDFLRSR